MCWNIVFAGLKHIKLKKKKNKTFDYINLCTLHTYRYDNTTGRGEFLQLSGIQVVYDLTKPNGSRVESVNIMCNNCNVPKFYPLSKTRQYTVILTTFLLHGGSRFEMLIVCFS